MSKGLEALVRIEDLLNKLYETDVINDDHTYDINIIGKELKALEIIKEKQVNIFSLLSSIEWFNPSHYNDSVGCPIGCELTQQEYDLLKEVLL